MNNLLTLEQLCSKLQCKPSFVYRLIHERRIPFIKLGHRKLRFDESVIEQWLDDRSCQPDKDVGNDVFK